MLVVSASIGEGHDLPARFIADGLLARRPDAVAPIVDGLRACGPLVERIILGGSAFHSALGNAIYDAEYALITHVAPVRRGFSRFGEALGARGLLRLVDAHRPDVVVSTYPGTTEVYGRLRLHGRLGVPLVSAITDLAALRYWSHPGVDLHLITHPESEEEVRAIAGSRTRIVAARGMNDPRFATPPSREEGAPHARPAGGGQARRRLGRRLGRRRRRGRGRGGARARRHARRRDVRAQRAAATAASRSASARWPRVTLLGFTTEVPSLFAGADALIHSTAGLTVLEAWARRLPDDLLRLGPRPHPREQPRATRASGSPTWREIATSWRSRCAARSRAAAHPSQAFARLPLAADVVLELIGARPIADVGARNGVAPVLAGDHLGDGG